MRRLFPKLTWSILDCFCPITRLKLLGLRHRCYTALSAWQLSWLKLKAKVLTGCIVSPVWRRATTSRTWWRRGLGARGLKATAKRTKAGPCALPGTTWWGWGSCKTVRAASSAQTRPPCVSYTDLRESRLPPPLPNGVEADEQTPVVQGAENQPMRSLRTTVCLWRPESERVVSEHATLVERPRPRCACTAMKKQRIVILIYVILRFGTARQKMVLERWTNPKPLGTIVDRAAI